VLFSRFGRFGSDNGCVALHSPTVAEVRARQCWQKNVAALMRLQADLCAQLSPPPDTWEWVLGRDGALTALTPDGWWAGCSVPRRSAERMLAKFDARGAMLCMLLPPHAHALEIVLERTSPEQAILVVEPDPLAAAMLLHCADLSRFIEGNRLFLATGELWDEMLRAILTRHAGLAMPSQYIRLPVTPADQINALVSRCASVFSEVAAERATLQRKHHDTPVSGEQICVLGQAHFHLWNDAAMVLASILAGERCVRLDQDDPMCASPLALAAAASQSRAVVTANIARSDLPGVVHPSKPWITWQTTPRIPAPTPAAAEDVLLLADPRWSDAALAAGWQQRQLHIAGWPAQTPQTQASGGAKPLALIADTMPLDCPDDQFELSSHTVLWRKIVHDLGRDPLSLGTDAGAYLQAQMRSLGISDEGLDRRLFIERVILHAYQQGLARLLIAAGLPLMLAGRGWDAIDGLAPAWAGPVETGEQLAMVAGAIVHGWPSEHLHRIDSLGRPVLRPGGQTRESLLRQARLAMRGELACAKPVEPALSMELIESIIAAVASRTRAA
jgi:hypothetical protein